MKAAVHKIQYWGLGVGLLPFAITQALAQAPAGGAATLDTVQVTGVRSSLQKSQIIKQDFIGTVDAVSSEDVGKFPDQNVADALQRVPGVSVDRSGGESRYITVRGFGPEFNAVTLNGRTMATESEGREFSFDVLPSELISAAEVQKTSTANSPEGSIGATVNIRTQRPLDNPGLHVSGAIAGTYDDTTESTKPKISGLISNTNADGTFGALLSVVRYQRNHNSEVASTAGWLTNDPRWPGMAMPRQLEYRIDGQNRTRTGTSAAFDWRPNDRVKLGVDAMYSRYEIDNSVILTNFDTKSAADVRVEDVTFDENGTATSFIRDGDALLFGTDRAISASKRDSTNWQVGANLAWEVSEYTTWDFDVSSSRADNESDPGKNYFIASGSLHPGVKPVWNLNPGGFPTYSNILPTDDMSDMRAIYWGRSGRKTSDDIGEFKTSLSHSFYDGVLSRLQFGTSGTTRTKEIYRVMGESGDLGCVYCVYDIARIPAEFFRVVDVGNVAGAGGPTKWLTWDPERYISFLESEAGWTQVAPGGEFYNPMNPTKAEDIAAVLARYGGLNPEHQERNEWKVREKTWAAFAQADFAGDWGAMPWQLNVGVRYVRTDVTSYAKSVQVESIETNPSDPSFFVIHFTDPLPISRQSRYHEWLPSINFRLNLRDDLVLRASASETLTRPTLTNLRVSENIGSANPPNPGTYSSGNVDLKPYLSKNVDLGLEWYVNDTSYMALAGFYKNVDNFIADITDPITIMGYPFMRTMPVNADSTIIKGAEFSFQYTFDRLPAPFDGLGMQVNYTYVESKQTFDPSIATGQFAVVGLSDSANLVLFYEKDRFGIRAAWNWRDEYLAAVRGEQGEPTTVTPYDQLDLSANFKLNDHLSIFADATNLTDERESAWSRYRSRVQRLIDNGRTMTLGIRGTW